MSEQDESAAPVLSRIELEFELARITVKLRESDRAQRIVAREATDDARWLYRELEALSRRTAPEHVSYLARRVDGIAAELGAVNLWQASPVDTRPVHDDDSPVTP